MSLKEFTIREYKDSDLQGVLSLWEHHSGWGRPETKEYEKWMQTPYGDCVVLVAEHQKEQIIGQLILTPTELVIYGKNQRALKMSAPIIHGDFRATNVMNLESLMIQIYLKAYQIVQKKEYDWFYSFPAVGWSKIMGLTHHFGLSPWKTNFFDCYEIIGSKSINTEYKLQILNSLPIEIESIWNKFKEIYKNKAFVTRDLKWLNYKWADDLKIGIYNSAGKLDGYAIIKQNSGLVLDFIMLSSAGIPDVINNLKHLFDNQIKTAGISNPALKFMKTSILEKWLGDVIIRPIDFQFVFGLSALKNSDLLDNIKLNDWYVFPND